MSTSPLRIAILAPPWFAVPPDGYGGIESVVALLADGLVDAGHDVTLFAAGGSRTRARLETAYERPPTEWIGNSYFDLRHVMHCLERADDFDVIHDHTGLVGLTAGGHVEVPFLHTVHGPVDGEPGDLYESVCGMLPRARLVSISHSQQRNRSHLPWFATVPNGLDLEKYPFRAEKEDYLLFLGRMSPDKGCHNAIEIAQLAGIPLRIAAKNREPLERQYFDRHVRPHLGHGVEYLGEVPFADKVALLQRARATLFPIEWEEPFGLVMVESAACGTPVLATRRGAVPEVIEHGVTGFVADEPRELAAYVEQASTLDPATLRAHAESRFSAGRLVADHVDLYHRAVDTQGAAGARLRLVGTPTT